MKPTRTADIRTSFLEYFQKHDHKLKPSSPVIPFDDPTILFTNAGMNQFKDIFTGKAKPDHPRATSSQKCIRAGGKHNDLDNVGFTLRHHTFFEMLGNFSFGDYFKEEAIKYAWDWVTNTLQLPKDKLYATVYNDDDEAFGLWEKIAPELKNGRIMRFGKADNYWSMGDIGPAGPCSEIHFDRGEKYGTGPNDVVNGETDRFVEIWNLVFMQFDQQPDGKVVPLPKPSVDTGAGLERIAAIMQNVDSNFEIDLFQNIIAAIEELTGTRYKEHVASHHVVADHLRALAFSLADGAGISNEGRGYVLRRILRRAARHGRTLGVHEPFIHKLVPVLVNEMGDTYPELREKQQHVQNVIRTEEESFSRTLETGLELLEKVALKLKSERKTVIDGRDVFRLYDTYGFPYDLTEIIAGEHGLSLDRKGFDEAMAEQQERSRAGGSFAAEGSSVHELLEAESLDFAATEFVRQLEPVEANLQAVFPLSDDNKKVALIISRTPFYLEAGGQISDIGRVYTDSTEIHVTDMQGYQDYYVHIGDIVEGDLKDLRPGVSVRAQISNERRWDIMRNHTATHLAHAALRRVLGDHVRQSGSYVGPDRLRFDFSHHQPMTDEQIAEVERLVNEQILMGKTVETEIMPVEKAKKAGAMALFGEKYGDTVRVVQVPGFSMELCGGTHVANIAQIGPFFVVQETGIASGVRRLEAITGREAQNYMLTAKRFRREVGELVNRPEGEALEGVRVLKESNADLQRELKKTREAMFTGQGASVGDEKTIGSVRLLTHDFGDTDRDTMGAWIDKQKESEQPIVAVGLGQVNGKRTFMAAASPKANKQFNMHVGNMARELLPQFGGRGGGKPIFAQGGIDTGADSAKVFDAVATYVEEKIGA